MYIYTPVYADTWEGATMQTQGFEFRVLPKTFQPSSTAHLTSENSVRIPPRLKKRLDLLRESTAKKPALGKLVQSYHSDLNVVEGKSLDEGGTLQRQKAKYYSNFSCSQTPSHHPLQQVNNNVQTGKTNLSKDTPDCSSQSVKSYMEYSKPRPSLSSERGSFIYGYDDEFFDCLNLPGHFNTRGIYGQKAHVAQLSLTRSKSDLFLNHDFLRKGAPERQRTFLSTTPLTPKYDDMHLRSNVPPLQLPKLLHRTYTSLNLNNKNESPKLQKKKKHSVMDVQITRDTKVRKIPSTSENFYLKTPRQFTVEATTQTEGNDEDYNIYDMDDSG